MFLPLPAVWTLRACLSASLPLPPLRQPLLSVNLQSGINLDCPFALIALDLSSCLIAAFPCCFCSTCLPDLSLPPSSYQLIRGGSFCGEELLSWGLQPRINLHCLPPALSTVTSLTAVEAFVLEAADLVYVTSHFAVSGPHLRYLVNRRYLTLSGEWHAPLSECPPLRRLICLHHLALDSECPSLGYLFFRSLLAHCLPASGESLPQAPDLYTLPRASLL